MTRLDLMWLDTCGSTNTELAALKNPRAGTVVAAREQTAGRGQRGNSWESEPGANLTFSQLFAPRELPVVRQFELSMLISLAVSDFADELLSHYGSPLRTKIKWPNDIYVGDRKLAGILIENRLTGRYIDRSIAGIGFNVNQTEFTSDAPNPVSIAQLIGQTIELEPLLIILAGKMADYVDNYNDNTQGLIRHYMERLYRGDGREYRFRRADGTEFSASITGVDPDGTLHLSDSRKYFFKEVVFVI